MNYPVWEINFAGGGLFIAVIAVLHVYVAHFAVGGGLFLVLTEMKGYRENSRGIIDYVKKHTKFFLLLTMVFGGVSGVGIWFSVSLIGPGATSTLIHTFVFGWAAEWVCFTGEITALFIYYYRFGKISRKAHLKIGWLYFIFGWLSLFFINGIVAFMLTPGKWIETQNFWHGFFNPTMWPSLFFRSSISFMFAGIFGFVTTVFVKETAIRNEMIRYCSKWIFIPSLFMALSAYWYLASLPDPVAAMITSRSPEITPWIKRFMISIPVILAGTVLMVVRLPHIYKKLLAFILVFAGLATMGSFEWIREAGRKPYVIHGHTYSTGILPDQEKQINKKGILNTARWVAKRSIKEDNHLQAGAEIFRLECLSCHSIGGPLNDILELTEKYSVFGMDARLNGQGKTNSYMPLFLGTKKERHALARYIIEGLHNRKEENKKVRLPKFGFDVPEFVESKDEFILMAWPDMGMRYVYRNSKYFVLKQPGSKVYAQVIRRGETPEIVTEDIELFYKVEPGSVQSSSSSEKFEGEMKYLEEKMSFTSDVIPVLPLTQKGKTNPYPLCTVVAKEKGTGRVLARTHTVIPVTNETGCSSCHGRKTGDQPSQISDETAKDILSVHDRISKTNLLKTASNGQPVACRSCHPAGYSVGGNQSGSLNLSASMHGFHAGYLANMGAEACYACHPSSPDQYTRSLRGIHYRLDMDCTSCHWRMEDHALSLLTAELKAGKKNAQNLIKHLNPTKVSSVDQVMPRKPWTDQPDCLNCHPDFSPPEIDEAEFNTWTTRPDQLFKNRSDDAGIMCPACHGQAHAIYPADNPMGRNRDNIQPLQYQGNPYPMGSNNNCSVCHTIDMKEEIHHPNMLTMFRNTE